MSLRAAVERLERLHERGNWAEVGAALRELRGYEGAVGLLATLVKDEYPSDHSLREVAETWGPHAPGADVLDALDRIEADLAATA